MADHFRDRLVRRMGSVMDQDVRIIVAGTTDVDYTTAWHYAAAFDQLGHDVDRRQTATDLTLLNIDGALASVRVGRIAGLDVALPLLDEHFFTDDGVWVAEQVDPRIHYLRAACHGPEAHESEAYPPWQPLWDVGFIGSSPGHPEWPHRAELVAHLHEWFGDRFIHVGPGGTGVMDDSRVFRTELRGHWLNRWYRSVPIVIGDTVLHNPTLPYWSERVYETWARGGFLIHPGNYLLRGEIGLYPGSAWQPGQWATLYDTIHDWLAIPHERAKVCAERQEQMRVEHTFTHRAQELLDTLGAS